MTVMFDLLDFLFSLRVAQGKKRRTAQKCQSLFNILCFSRLQMSIVHHCRGFSGCVLANIYACVHTCMFLHYSCLGSAWVEQGHTDGLMGLIRAFSHHVDQVIKVVEKNHIILLLWDRTEGLV